MAPVPLGDADLAEQRAGFSYAGMDIQFGVEIRSYLDDELVLQTNFTSGGGLIEVIRSSVTDGGATDPALSLTLDNATVTLANQGQTAFIQRATGTIQNIIVNSASGVTLRQDVDATLDIAGYVPFREDLFAQRVGSALSAMSALGLAQGASH
ncbi:MAG: hypothetical protein QM676_02160 [Novosphingobium sp.]